MFLNSYEQNDGLLVGHQLKKELGVEDGSMSLGMEMSFTVGKALIAWQTEQNYHIYCLLVLGDVECEEGPVWESFISAAHYKLDNLTVIIDRNRMSVDGISEWEKVNAEFNNEWWNEWHKQIAKILYR